MPVFLGLFLSCKHKTDENTALINTDTSCCYVPDAGSASQSAIGTLQISEYPFIDTLYFEGITEPDPNYQRLVSAPMKGFLKAIHVHCGQQVGKGELLAVLEHPGYAQLQFEFLEVKARYEYFKQDYARQGELGLELATSLKNVQKAQRDFSVTESEYYALKKQLEYIGIIADSIRTDNITSTIRITSPIEGMVTFENLVAGKLFDGDEPLFLITDRSRLVISYSVLQADLSKIKQQSVLSFTIPVDTSQVYTATILSSFSPTDEDDGKLTLYAGYINGEQQVNPGMKVNVFLIRTDTVFAIPAEAIISYTGRNYVFISEKEGCFRLLEINTGRKQKGRIEIRDVTPFLLNNNIVCSGKEALTAFHTKK
jgi:cobalt-zinc-cadmium efflux system membrane fusion protein